MATQIKPKPYAAAFFKTTGQGTTKLDSIPRYKFMYYARFIPSAAALADTRALDYKQLGSFEKGISFKIHSVDKPKVELSAVELNQYNRKRFAYTKVEYQPFTMKIHDTVDDIPLKMWVDYFTYYFGDSRLKNRGSYLSKVSDGNFGDTYSSGYGLTPELDSYNFFDKVEIYALANGLYTQFNYINPKIVSIDWGNYESSSSELGEVSLTLRYEAIEYVCSDIRLSNQQKLDFGFKISDTNEVQGLQTTNTTLTPYTYSEEDKASGTKNYINSVAGRNVSLMPTDIANNIALSEQAQLANTQLKIYSDQSLRSIAGQTGTVIAQTNYTGFYNVPSSVLYGGPTNPYSISSFIGGGITGISSLPYTVGTTLGQFGAFGFGGIGSKGNRMDLLATTQFAATTVDNNWDQISGFLGG